MHLFALRKLYNIDMPSDPRSASETASLAVELTAPEMSALLDAKEREVIRLRRQVAWFQRQIFGQKSERRMPEPAGVQGTLGEAFDVVPASRDSCRVVPSLVHWRIFASAGSASHLGDFQWLNSWHSLEKVGGGMVSWSKETLPDPSFVPALSEGYARRLFPERSLLPATTDYAVDKAYSLMKIKYVKGIYLDTVDRVDISLIGSDGEKIVAAMPPFEAMRLLNLLGHAQFGLS
jgi:hypothetical protein